MKIQIRNGVFETNSSSTHALCVAKEMPDMTKVKNKQLVFKHKGFGWQFKELHDVESRASYLYEALLDYKSDYPDAINWIYETLGKYGIEASFEIEYEDEFDRWVGGIDHSEGLVSFLSYVMRNENHLIKWLFGNSLIITGNDNGDEFNDRVYMYDKEDDHYVLKPEFRKYKFFEKGN